MEMIKRTTDEPKQMEIRMCENREENVRSIELRLCAASTTDEVRCERINVVCEHERVCVCF